MNKLIIAVIILLIIIIAWSFYSCEKKEGYCIPQKTACGGAEPTLMYATWDSDERPSFCKDRIDSTDDVKRKPYYDWPVSSHYWKHPGMTFFGYDLKHYPELKGQNCELARLCNVTPHCLGFDSSGKLKSYIRNPSEWSYLSAWRDKPELGLYVKQQVEQRI